MILNVGIQELMWRSRNDKRHHTVVGSVRIAKMLLVHTLMAGTKYRVTSMLAPQKNLRHRITAVK